MPYRKRQGNERPPRKNNRPCFAYRSPYSNTETSRTPKNSPRTQHLAQPFTGTSVQKSCSSSPQTSATTSFPSLIRRRDQDAYQTLGLYSPKPRWIVLASRCRQTRRRQTSITVSPKTPRSSHCTIHPQKTNTKKPPRFPSEASFKSRVTANLALDLIQIEKLFTVRTAHHPLFLGLGPRRLGRLPHPHPLTRSCLGQGLALHFR